MQPTGPHDLVEVERAFAAPDLAALHARLQAEGIRSLIADGDTNRMNPLWSVAMGGARLLVPREQLPAAREIIGLVKSGAFALREDEDPEV